MRCPGCAFESPDRYRFCGRCGTRIPAVDSPLDDAADDTAERRLLTVMFCEFVGTASLGEGLPPEHLREVVRLQQGIAEEVVARFEGHVAQKLQDCVLVYFGFPVAHEEDPRRALLAGLEMLRRVRELDTERGKSFGIRFGFRIGIHTGLVVVGEVGSGARTDRLALGQTPNVAARILGLAAPDTLVISEATQALVKGLFELDPLGRVALKGVAEPMGAWRAIRETRLQSRFEVQQAGGLAPLVGRNEEIALLRDRFGMACAGRGQAVLLSGDPGIGKSRLHQVLEETIATDVAVKWVFRCSAWHQAAALHPVIELLQRTLLFRREDAVAQKLAKLRKALRRWNASAEDMVPLLAPLLSLPLPDDQIGPLRSPQRQREETVEALLDLLLRQTENGTVLLTCEDLHWVDPSTLELLDRLVARAPRHRLMVVLTFRPSFQPPWAAQPDVTWIRLEKLGEKQAEAMVAAVSGGIRLASEVVAEIISRTDGVPLFVEEFTRMLLDSGLLERAETGWRLGGRLPANAIPFSLQDSLTARLDRLDIGKDVAQLGAVLGREFSYPLVEAVARMEESSLRRRLSAVVASEMLSQQGEPPEATYVFRHALIRDAAYETLLKSRRRQIHGLVGQVLEERFPEARQTQPEVLAHHFEHGGMPEKAIDWLQAAGERSISRWAHPEAIQYFARGVDLLAGLEDSPDRDRRELALRSARGVALIATRGYAADEVERNYDRASELCRGIGDTPFRVRFGVWAVHLMRGDREGAQVLATEFEQQVEDRGTAPVDPRTLLMTHASLGVWSFYRGAYAAARRHFARTVELFNPSDHVAVTREYGGSGGFYGHMVVPWMDCLTGHADTAVRGHDEAILLAESLGEPYTQAETVSIGILLGKARREPWRVEASARRLSALSAEQALVWPGSIAAIGLGWAMAERGNLAEGLAQVEAGLAVFRATGTKVWYPYYASQRAELLHRMGRSTEALVLLEELLVMSRDTVDSYFVPELNRLRGELLLAVPDAGRPEAAEECFRTAMAEAERDGARLLELRAATSLARWLRNRGATSEACSLLAPRLAWFTEGLDTGDLRDAREVLAVLQHGQDGGRS